MLNRNLDFDINNKENLVNYFNDYLNNNGWNKTTQSEQAFYQNATSNLLVKKLVRKECYKLSKLNVTKITNMVDVFIYSLFEGDILEWNTSNVTNMDYMFYNTIEFNQPLNFDTTNVISMEGMFYKANIFNQPIIFDISKATIMSYMFEKTKAFLDKYNSGEPLPYNTKKIKEWFNNNRDKMNEIDIKEKHGEEVDSFFNKIQTNSIQEKDI